MQTDYSQKTKSNRMGVNMLSIFSDYGNLIFAGFSLRFEWKECDIAGWMDGSFYQWMGPDGHASFFIRIYQKMVENSKQINLFVIDNSSLMNHKCKM